MTVPPQRGPLHLLDRLIACLGGRRRLAVLVASGPARLLGHELEEAQVVLDRGGVLPVDDEADIGRVEAPASAGLRAPLACDIPLPLQEIIRNNTSRRDELVVILDERTIAKDDNLAAYLQQEIPNIKHVQLGRLTDRPLALARKFRVFEWKPPR